MTTFDQPLRPSRHAANANPGSSGSAKPPSQVLRAPWQAIRLAAFAVPATILMIGIFAVPLVDVVVRSLMTDDGKHVSIAAYRKILETSLFWQTGLTTVEVSASATVVALLLGYPIAYFMSKQPPRRRVVLMISVLVPFWTSVLVKSFALTVILGNAGIVNQALAVFGLGPVKLLFSRIGVLVGMSHFLVPFMIFPILTSILGQPPELAKAAASMGAGKWRIFWRITFPLSVPGVMAGALLAFVLSLGFYVVPALLGGRKDMMMANIVDFYVREVLDWPMASAISTLLLFMAVATTILLSKIPGGSSLLSGEAQ